MAGLSDFATPPPRGALGLFGLGSSNRATVDPRNTLLGLALSRATYLTPKEYKPGERVDQSGIYRVVHDGNHAQPHEVTSVLNEVFPPCRDCGPHPRFTLVRAAVHIRNETLLCR